MAGKQGSKISRLRFAASIAAVGVLIPVSAFCVSGMVTRLPGEEKLGDGRPRNQALYVRMGDGTPIAIDIWYPHAVKPGGRVPALMHMTRYWRARETGFVYRALVGLGLMNTSAVLPTSIEVFNKRGYAVVQVDARGSGASFGTREAELGPKEIRDYAEIADWIVRQDWSNGRIGSFGISYNGNAAELILGTGHPAIKASAPQFADFDFQLGVLQPGGTPIDFVPMWSAMVAAMDRNDNCGANGLSGWACLVDRITLGGVKPVDGRSGHEQLRQAIAQHRGNTPLIQAFSKVRFRDDRYGQTNLTIEQLNAYGHKAEIEARKIPMQVWAGWFDAGTVSGVLSRFGRFANPQDVVIGALSHGGAHDTDPFSPDDAPPSPSSARQYAEMASFFDGFLKRDDGRPQHRITYYTMGKRRWCRTLVWPPTDMRETIYHLAKDRALAVTDTLPTGTDAFGVDFENSTGSRNRWMTNLDYGDVVYDGGRSRAALPGYISPPLTTDAIVTGAAQLTLYLSSSKPDYAVHAYLESVAPDGRVRHMAEGILRSWNHRLSDRPNPSDIYGPKRSYLRGDAALPRAGEVTRLDIGFTPVSMLVPRGYRLRLSLAGADRSIFPRLPGRGPLDWTIYFGAGTPSRLTLPIEGKDSCHVVSPF